MNYANPSERKREIQNELARLYNAQTEFYRKGSRAKNSNHEIAEFEKRREQIRALFKELEHLRNEAEQLFP